MSLTVSLNTNTSLLSVYDPNHLWEIGVDEAGRGPLFGRLYVAATVLPKDTLTMPKDTLTMPKATSSVPKATSSVPKATSSVPKATSSMPKATSSVPTSQVSFRHCDMKDSKKFHSEKKIRAVAEYIKTNAVAWHVQYVDESTIDKINIRQAVLRAMHECCRQCIRQICEKYPETRPIDDIFLLIDGNDFVPYTQYYESTQSIEEIHHQTIEGGDNRYTPIAAASILAKVARDDYIHELCSQYPELDLRYGISKNKGYGTKRHLDGIREHGISEWHRRTFGLCARSQLSPVQPSPQLCDSGKEPENA